MGFLILLFLEKTSASYRNLRRFSESKCNAGRVREGTTRLPPWRRVKRCLDWF